MLAVRRYANMTLEAGYRTVLSISRASSYGSGWYLPPFCGAFTSMLANQLKARCGLVRWLTQLTTRSQTRVNSRMNPFEPDCGMIR